MKRLVEYEVLNNDVFYKGWHIFKYIECHSDMSELDKEAISATIMDALVYKGLIDPESEFLSWDSLAITNNPNDYHYSRTPNVCGIPLEIKEQLRQKCIHQTGGLPISMFIAKPPSKQVRFCVYDPNMAVSSIFDDFTFYEALYTSPTRGVRLTETRPFVEVPFHGEFYLVDTITNRIFKTSHFKEQYDLEIVSETKKKNFTEEQEQVYAEWTTEYHGLANAILLIKPILDELDAPEMAEEQYELEKSKEFFPEEWRKSEMYIEEMKMFLKD